MRFGKSHYIIEKDSKLNNPFPKYDLPDQKIYAAPPKENPNQPDTKTVLKHVGLFLLTFFFVSWAGAQFVGFQGAALPIVFPVWSDFLRGVLFAVLLLGFLGVHEFGHYFAAFHHKIKVTLPYFIPLPLGIGTMGAVIRIKQKINHTYKMFDIGVAGPLAGFVVALGVLLYGFATLPDASYILNFQGHEAVKDYVLANGHYPSQIPENSEGQLIVFGSTLLYGFLASFFQNVPPMWEMYHYPFLLAGWFGLFFTALNLTPVGQLDGGHILYSLIGFKKHRIVARLFFGVLVTLAGIEAIPFIHQSLGELGTAFGTLSILIWAGVLFFLLRKGFGDDHEWIAPVLVGSLAVSVGYLYVIVGSLEAGGSLLWLVWSFFIAYLVGVEHPPATFEEPLSPTRKFLGWLSMVIFVLCISPNPIYIL